MQQIMLSANSQTKKSTYSMIQCMQNSFRKQMEEELKEGLQKGITKLLGYAHIFIILIVVIVLGCQNIKLYTFKYVQFILSIIPQ